MSKRTLIALALLALALVGYIVVFERDSVTSKEREGRAGRVLVSFVRDKVERLTVQRKGTTVVLVRNKLKDGEAAGFKVLEPYAAKADQDAVDQLLGELEWLSARRTLMSISSEDETRFGLAAPRYRVSFEVAGAPHTLAVGNGDVHGDSLYVRVDHERRAYVVPRTLLEVLDREPGSYRDKQLFPELTVLWVQKLALGQGDKSRAWLRESGRWWTSAQPRTYADGKRIDELLHALSELRAAHYPDATAQQQALFAAPAARLEVAVVPDQAREDKQPRSYVLELAGPCPGHPGERYVRSSTQGSGAGLVSCVAEADLQVLELGDETLADPRLFQSEPSSIMSFVLTRGDQKLALVREGEGWKAQSDGMPAVAAIDRTAVEVWLRDLSDARATAYTPLSGPGPDGKPRVTTFVQRGSLALQLADKRSESIALGEQNSADELVVKRGDETLLVSFPSSVFDRLLPLPGRFASLEPWRAHQPSEVVRVSARAGLLARTLTLDKGAWKSSGDTGQTGLDSERIRELVRSLIGLRELAYLTTQPRALHGLQKPTSSVELSLASGETLSLELGAASDRGGYARVATRGAAHKPGDVGSAVVEVASEVSAIITELAGAARLETPGQLERAEPAAEEADEEDETDSLHDHAH